jgi:hypothetical protein
MRCRYLVDHGIKWWSIPVDFRPWDRAPRARTRRVNASASDVEEILRQAVDKLLQ